MSRGREDRSWVRSRQQQDKAVQLLCLGMSSSDPTWGEVPGCASARGAAALVWRKRGEWGPSSDCLLCSCGIPLTLQWLFHLLSTSLIVIPVNPLRDPWELLSIRAQILLFPITACSHLLAAHRPPEHRAAEEHGRRLQGHQPQERGPQINKQMLGVVNAIKYTRN